jgi:hypothetical protein
MVLILSVLNMELLCWLAFATTVWRKSDGDF